MTVLDSLASEAIEAVRSGRHVRIAGKRLSGRTTMYRAVVQGLESDGFEVIQANGDRAAADQPGYILDQLRSGLGHSGRSRDLAAAVDSLARSISRDDIVAVDDLHLVDALSLHAITAARQRIGFRMVVTERLGRPRDEDLPPVWPETLFMVPDLDLADSASVLRTTLGAVADQRTLMLLFGKSGGSLGLLAALADSARVAGLIALEDGQWKEQGRGLWNHHLVPLLDGLLAELDHGERELIRWMAEEGPLSIHCVLGRYPLSVLQSVLDLNFVVPGGQNESDLLQAWPPMLVARFRNGPRIGSGTLLESGVSGSESTVLLGNTQNTPLAQLSRAFAAHDEDQARANFRVWSIAPTLDHALDYLPGAMGMDAEASRVRRVLTETRPHADQRGSAEALAFAVRKIEWLLFEERDEAAARDALESAVAENPDRELSLRTGYSALIALSGGGAADVPTEVLPAHRDLLFYTGRLGLALMRGDHKTLRLELEQIRTRDDMASLVAYLEPACLLLEGRAREAFLLAQSGREEARERLDRAEYCILSYIAELCAHYLGDQGSLETILSEAAVVGKPRVVWGAVHGAFLTMQAGSAHFSGKPALRDGLLREITLTSPETGPYLGMGTDFISVVAQHSEDPEEFDLAVSVCVDRRIKMNYLVGATQTAVAGLTISWGDHLARSFLRAHHESPLPSYENTAALVALLLKRDLESTGTLLTALSERSEDRDLLLRVVGAAMRTARKLEDVSFAEGLLRLINECFQPAAGAPVENELVQLLSGREQEIGRLAGRLRNSVIAERLGLSRRTVENHISNALRKTGLSNREALAALLREPGRNS